ncbi:MAG: hypothetical protein RLT87_02715 [Gammaproteobacteria bacterium]
MIRYVKHQDETLAIIVSHRFREEGIHFFTPSEYSQQLAYMQHPAGKKIEPHLHNAVKRNITYTQEVLFIKKGKLRVDFYSSEQSYLESHVLDSGDVILLITGGHGFEVLEDIEMIEVKQGPFVGEQDKTRFDGVSPENINIKD